EDEAVARVEPEQLIQLLAPVFDPKEKAAAVSSGKLLGKGLPAGPGAAPGRVALDAKKAVAVGGGGGGPGPPGRAETSPEDIAGMNAAAGILTTRGGMTCVAGESRVLTNRGMLSAEAAFAAFGDGQRLRILSFDTSRLRPVWRDVIAAGSRDADVVT